YRLRRSEDEITSYVGMIIFLGSWAMMFAALFFAYAVVRVRAPMWPPPDEPALPILIPGLNTVVIAGSSAAVAVAVRAHALGRQRRPRGMQGVQNAGIQGADEAGRKNDPRLGAHRGRTRLRSPLPGLPWRQGRRQGPRRAWSTASATRFHPRILQVRRRPRRHAAERRRSGARRPLRSARDRDARMGRGPREEPPRHHPVCEDLLAAVEGRGARRANR